MENKVKALAEFLQVEQDSISNIYGNTFESSEGVGKYLVVTEEEREKEVTDYIEQTLWAFNSSFLANMTDLPEEVFMALSEKCEAGNEPIRKIIVQSCGLDTFIEAAVDIDGYGHFLSSYDGNENGEMIDGEYYYIYRVN